MGKGYYKTLGDFAPFEARRLLARFENEKIRFMVDGNDSGIKNMDPVTAAYGGFSGASSSIRIYVHTGDQEKMQKILDEICHV